jgi:HAD superfamily hydrolase (TIGR01509 family)
MSEPAPSEPAPAATSAAAPAPAAPAESDLRGLVVDWGGVLTGDLRAAVQAWAEADGVDLEAYVSIMRDWFGEPVGAEARLNPIHALERGEMTVPDFESRLAVALTERTGTEYEPQGLLTRMFERFEHAHDMSGLVRRARGAGLRTALLSNSWGNDYPRDGWDEMFDAIVISGEVGMRKPEPRIYEHTLGLLGLPAGACVFVDDMPHNVAAAVEVGMVGVLHTSYDATLLELEALFDRPLG